MRLSVSPERPEWKAALAAAVGSHETATGRGPVELALRFGVSPERNWVTLWKPAIDALGGILGEGARRWHPRDDRISVLILQRELRTAVRVRVASHLLRRYRLGRERRFGLRKWSAVAAKLPCCRDR